MQRKLTRKSAERKNAKRELRGHGVDSPASFAPVCLIPDNFSRQLFAGLEAGVALAASDGKLLYANPRFAAILGSPRAERSGGHLRQLVGSEGWKQFGVAFRRASSRPIEVEREVLTLSGKLRTIRLSFARMRGPGSIVRIFATDVSELSEARASLKSAEEYLHSLSGRILRLQDEERRRMARDLHDLTGQKLAVAVISLSRLVKNATGLDDKDREELNDSLKAIRVVEKEIRTLSYLLHPPLLEDHGLASTLRSYIEGIIKRSGLQIALEISPDFGRIEIHKEMALFRVVQESLTNVLRHSGSSQALIRAQRSVNEIRISVEDRGKGIDAETLARLESHHETLGVGIPGIRERLKQLGGTLEIHSDKSGTRIVASVPASGDAIIAR